MIAYALLGGPQDCWPANIKQIFQAAKEKNDLIIGVDRGSLLLTEMGVMPDLAIGDFDSLHLAEKNEIEAKVTDIRYSNPVKDFTDTELMVRAALNDYRVAGLKIFGATGGRLDHFLANLYLVFAADIRRSAEKIVLLDKQNVLQFYLPGKHRIVAKKGYSYFGVAALGAVKDLNIRGARYSLKNYSSPYPCIFTSNEFLPGQPYFNLSFTSGLIALIFAKDIDRYYNLDEKKS